jgi:hypothetical protein
MSLLPGTRVGPYEIAGPLGAGGMGEVYRARDPRIGREVAIKVLPRELASDPDRLRRFEQEARAAGALNHPNVLVVLDVGEHGGAPYLVTELLEGETLRERLASGALPVRKTVDIGTQIARGLAAAHEKGIVHRDLKPENVFLTRDGHVKILDFGLAKVGGPMLPDSGETLTTPPAGATGPGVVLGTVGYMSPEQVRGLPADARSDIFSFGSVLYEMFSGQRAFKRDSSVETMNAILKEELPELEIGSRPLTPGLQRILHHCLEKDPAHRFHDAHDLAFALEDLGSSVSEERRAEARGMERRQRAWSRSALLLRVLPWLVAMASVVAALWMRGPRSGPAPGDFRQINLRTEAIFRAAFAPDGTTVVYSAAGKGNRPELFVVRPDNPVPQSMGLRDTHLLNVSSQGEMAVLIGARYIHHRLFTGTLARVPTGGGAPREVLENVRDADWAPDASQLAIIRDANGKDRLEYPIGTVLLEVSGYLSDLRVSPQGNQIACFEHPIRWDDRGAVIAVDPKGRVRVLADGFEALEGLAWSADGKEILFSGTYAGVNNHRLYAVDLAGRKRVVFESPGGITLQDIHRTGRWLTTRDDLVAAVMANSDGAEEDRDLSWLEGSYNPVLSRDGRTILFSDYSLFAGASYALCMRGVDGSPVVRLGEGDIQDLSIDGKWVLSHLFTTPARLMVYPTGAGEPRRVELGDLEPRGFAEWFRDATRIMVVASKPGRGMRCYLASLNGGSPRPLTPEGIVAGHLSPDERWVLVKDSGGAHLLYPVEGGDPRPARGLDRVDEVIRWSADGRSVLVRRGTEIPCSVERVEPETGHREMFRTIAPSDLTGLIRIRPTSFSDDEKSYAYQVNRMTSKLFVSEPPR